MRPVRPANSFIIAGDCIYLKSCASLFEIAKKRPVSHEERLFLSLSQCGLRDGQPLVCCRETASPPPTAPPVTQPPPASRNPLLPRPPDCGIDLTDRIYGGNITKVDEYPWMVLLQYSKRKCYDISRIPSFSQHFFHFNSQQQEGIPLWRCIDKQPLRHHR